jgi:RNA polymerase sigma-70 factor (ECF subfamily)
MDADDRTAATASPPELDYVQLVERIGAGDRAAEETLFLHFQHGICTMLMARTHDRELAQDLQQEALWEAIAALRRGQLREPLKLPGFVVTIARNLLSHYFRTSQRRPRMTALPANLAAPAPGTCMDDENDRLVADALLQISANDRMILQSILVDGASLAQIAQRHGLSAEVVRKRKSRALSRLRKLVHKEGDASGTKTQKGSELRTGVEAAKNLPLGRNFWSRLSPKGHI